MPEEPDRGTVHEDEHGTVGSWLPGLHEDLLNPPQQDRSRRSLAQILEAAEAVWARDGLDGITMAAISEESGISIGGLYSRFNGKRGLVRAIKDRLLTRLENDVAQRLGEHAGGLGHTVRAFVTCLAGADGRRVGRLLAAWSTDEELITRGAAARATLFSTFRDAALRDRRQIRHEDPEVALLMAFHVAVNSLPVVDVVDTRPGFPDSIEQVRDEVTRICLAYLCGDEQALPTA